MIRFLTLILVLYLVLSSTPAKGIFDELLDSWAQERVKKLEVNKEPRIDCSPMTHRSKW
jgi:hypothetical protein